MSDQNNSKNNQLDPYVNPIPAQQGQPPQQTTNPQPQIVYNGGGANYIGGGGGGLNGQIIIVSPNNNGWFIGGVPVPATETVEKKPKDKDGCFCKKCKDFFPYAEPNQEDGTLVCYACRKGL